MFARFLPLALIALPVQAQKPVTDDGAVGNDDLSTYATTWPQIIGGLEGLQQEIRYPEAAKAEGIEGTVYVHFVIDEEGRAREERVLSSSEVFEEPPGGFSPETRAEIEAAARAKQQAGDVPPPVSSNPEFVAEALRVVRQARYEPGTKHGEPVKVTLKLPIVFKLDADRTDR